MISLSSFRNLNILVVGDVIVDKYRYGSAEKLSPEAPVPVVVVQEESYRPGGAANVAANLKHLGCEVTLCGYVGHDNTADNLYRMLGDLKVHYSLVKCSSPTIEKMRVIANGQHVVRVDVEKKLGIKNGERMLLEEEIKALATNKFDAVIVSDYAKGTISESTTNLIKTLFTKSKIIADPKPVNKKFYHGFHLICPNSKEAAEMMPLHPKDPALLAHDIKKELGLQNVIITLSSEGVLLLDDKDVITQMGVHKFNAVERYSKIDVTGAGDTLISTFTACICSGHAYSEALFISNVAAAIVVNKLGTEVCTIEELVKELGG